MRRTTSWLVDRAKRDGAKAAAWEAKSDEREHLRPATKRAVLPNFMSVVDDPTLKVFQGKSLVGSYAVDSEGVKAKAVNCHRDGCWANYLIGRQPIRDFSTSNGHGRAAREISRVQAWCAAGEEFRAQSPES